MLTVRVTVECIQDGQLLDSVMRTIEHDRKHSQDEIIGMALGTALVYLTKPDNREKVVKAFETEVKP